MSTPIETNTEELQEVLQQVYNLPSRSGASESYDLVIGFNLDGYGLGASDGSSPHYNHYGDEVRLSLYSIVSGSVAAVVDKMKQGKRPRVLLKLLQAYDWDCWDIGVCESYYTALTNYNKYPDGEYTQLCLYFFFGQLPSYNNLQASSLLLKYDLDTGNLTWAEPGYVSLV